jgi:uncharacterized membrane protein YhaH (DUF805 family)
MGLVSFLFSFKGRVGRGAYLLGTFGFFFLTVLLMLAVGFEMPTPGQLPAPPGLGVSLVLLVLSVALMWSTWALGAKRLHDINKSGWWLGAGIAACLVAGLVGLVVPVLGGLGFLGAGLLGLYVSIQMLLFKGDKGPNDFGPPPSVMTDILGEEGNSNSDPEWAQSAMSKASPARLVAPAAQSGHKTGPKSVPKTAATTTVTRVARSPKMVGVAGVASPAGFGRRT